MDSLEASLAALKDGVVDVHSAERAVERAQVGAANKQSDFPAEHFACSYHIKVTD